MTKDKSQHFIIPKNIYSYSLSPSSILGTYTSNDNFSKVLVTINDGSSLYVSTRRQVLNLQDLGFPYFALSGKSLRNQTNLFNVDFETLAHSLKHWLQIFAPYSRSLIIRGIGYRLYPLVSSTNTDIIGPSYQYRRYIYLRAGHSYPTYCFVPNHIGIRTTRKERKLVVYGFNNMVVGMFSDRLFYYRPPNVFTGRGIRFKRVKYKRKPGKRAQKGRGF